MEKRVKFDFEVFFTNGGSISGTDFRLDIHGDDITDQELAEYIVRDMNLLMAGETRILNKEIIREAHKRKPKHVDSGVSFIDLSHTIENGLVTYKGLPPPVICDYLSREDSKKYYEEGTQFQIGKIEMVSNTGTYIDCPFHRYEHGKDLSQMDLHRFCDLEGTCIRVPYTQSLAVTVEHIRHYPVRDKAVLIHTGWDEHWNTPSYYEGHPYLTSDAAEFLRDNGAVLVGIDSHNIDNTAVKSRPVHTILLGAEILIVEHLCNLQNVPHAGFWFTALPPKFKGVGTFPVRAMAKVAGSPG